MKSLFQMSKRALAVCVAVLMLIGLLPVGGLLASAATVEKMIGGDFETGAITGSWQSQTNVPVVSDYAHGGSYAAKVDYNGNPNNMLQGYVQNLTAGVPYTFSFWYYVPAGGTVQIQLMMQGVASYAALPGESNAYSVPVSNGSLAAHDTWLQFTKTFTLAEGDSGLLFQLYSRQAGDIYYIDDVSVSYEEAEPEEIYVDIDFDVETDKVNSVNYNSANIRTYLEVQTAQTLPIDGWAGYSGNATLLIDGVEVAAKAAGLGSANKFQIYTADGTGDFTGASEITIPAGTTFTKDNATVRFPKDFTIVKVGGAWQKKSAEPEITYTDIDFDVETDTISSVGYNDGAQRTYLVIQSAQTLPVADWGAYAGNTTVLVDGVSVQAKAAGMANANQFQLYFVGDTTNYTTASEITVPAGTTFTKDNAAIRFTKDFTIVKKNGAWVKYVPAPEVSDHTTSAYPEIPEDMPNLASGGDFANGIPSDWIATTDLVTVENGMAKVTGNSQLVTVITGDLVADHTFVYSMYYWVSEANNNPQFLLQAYYADSTGEKGYAVKYSPVFTDVSEGWVRFTYEYTLPEDASSAYRLSFQIQSLEKASANGTGTMYVDDISVYDRDGTPIEIVTPTDHGGDTELSENAVSAGVQNGDFNATTGQNFVGNSSIENGMAKIEVSGTDDYIQFNGATVKAGVEYTLAFYVWITEASADMDFDLYMTGAGAPSAWLDFTLGNAAVTSNPTDGFKAATEGWQRVTVTWTAPADGEAIFGLKNYSGSATGVVYIDDVSVTYEDTVEYIEIYANMVDLFAAQAQAGSNRTVFGIEIDGVNIPYDASWRNFGYRDVLIDGVSANIPFGTTTSTNTWGMDANENKMLLYLPLAAYEATTVTIPAGTKLTHPVDTTLAYEFVEDIVITKSADCGWPEMLLRGAEVALGDACRSDIVIHVPSHYAEAGLQLQYTVNGVTDTAALTAVGNGLHTASIATSLKNIGDVYALQVVDADGKAVGLPVETYSVEEYAVMIAGSEDYTEEAQNAAMMLLNAGLKAQRYFGYNLDDEIAEWVTFPQETIEAIDEHILTNLPDMVIPDGADNYVGSSLVLKDVTKIRMYFTTQVTGSVLAGNGFYYLEIGNIDALNLDTMYDVVVDGSTYQISVNSLVKQVIASESTSEAFKELARAMFLYNEAAEMM